MSVPSVHVNGQRCDVFLKLKMGGFWVAEVVKLPKRVVKSEFSRLLLQIMLHSIG